MGKEEGWSPALRALAAERGAFSELGSARAARPLRAIANPTRVGIVLALAHGAASRVAIAEMLACDEGLVAFHVCELIAAGLVEAALPGRDSDASIYRLTEQGRLTLPVLILLGVPPELTNPSWEPHF